MATKPQQGVIAQAKLEEILSSNKAFCTRELAEKVNVNSSTIQRRLKKMMLAGKVAVVEIRHLTSGIAFASVPYYALVVEKEAPKRKRIRPTRVAGSTAVSPSVGNRDWLQSAFFGNPHKETP